MASWILVPCLVTLRGEFNLIAPKRDKASDGSVGDPRHAANSSDHNPDETGRTPSSDTDRVNEVHAIDVDKELRQAGWDMNRCLQIIITRHRAGLDDRLQNVIYNRRIWSRSWGWTARTYTGSNAHTQHGHFSARYGSAQEASTKPWGLAEAFLAGKAAGVNKPGTRTIRKGAVGDDVAFLRRWLGLPVGRSFDAALDKKLRAYQKMRGIAVDGICGPGTWSQILGRKVKF